MDKTAAMTAMAAGDLLALIRAMEPDEFYLAQIEVDPATHVSGPDADYLARIGAMTLVVHSDGCTAHVMTFDTPDVARANVEQQLSIILDNMPSVTVVDLRTDTVLRQGVYLDTVLAAGPVRLTPAR